MNTCCISKIKVWVDEIILVSKKLPIFPELGVGTMRNSVQKSQKGNVKKPQVAPEALREYRKGSLNQLMVHLATIVLSATTVI